MTNTTINLNSKIIATRTHSRSPCSLAAPDPLRAIHHVSAPRPLSSAAATKRLHLQRARQQRSHSQRPPTTASLYRRRPKSESLHHRHLALQRRPDYPDWTIAIAHDLHTTASTSGCVVSDTLRIRLDPKSQVILWSVSELSKRDSHTFKPHQDKTRRMPSTASRRPAENLYARHLQPTQLDNHHL